MSTSGKANQISHDFDGSRVVMLQMRSLCHNTALLIIESTGNSTVNIRAQRTTTIGWLKSEGLKREEAKEEIALGVVSSANKHRIGDTFGGS